MPPRATREQILKWVGGEEDGRQTEYLLDICMEKVNAPCTCCNIAQDVIDYSDSDERVWISYSEENKDE